MIPSRPGRPDAGCPTPTPIRRSHARSAARQRRCRRLKGPSKATIDRSGSLGDGLTNRLRCTTLRGHVTKCSELMMNSRMFVPRYPEWGRGLWCSVGGAAELRLPVCVCVRTLRLPAVGSLPASHYIAMVVNWLARRYLAQSRGVSRRLLTPRTSCRSRPFLISTVR